jgi:hypothetical protein
VEALHNKQTLTPRSRLHLKHTNGGKPANGGKPFFFVFKTMQGASKTNNRSLYKTGHS